MGGGLVISLIVSFISLVKTSELNTPGLQGKSSWYHENPWEISDFISCANAHLMVRKRCKISCGPVSNFQYAMALYVDCSAVNLTLRSQTMSIEFICIMLLLVRDHVETALI